jgi:hypothetical protein
MLYRNKSRKLAFHAAALTINMVGAFQFYAVMEDRDIYNLRYLDDLKKRLAKRLKM